MPNNGEPVKAECLPNVPFRPTNKAKGRGKPPPLDLPIGLCADIRAAIERHCLCSLPCPPNSGGGTAENGCPPGELVSGRRSVPETEFP